MEKYTDSEDRWTAQAQRHGKRKSRRGRGGPEAKTQAVSELNEELEHEHLVSSMNPDQPPSQESPRLRDYYRTRFAMHRAATQRDHSRRAWDRPYRYVLYHLGDKSLEACGQPDTVDSYTRTMQATGSIKFDRDTGKAKTVVGKHLSNAFINASLAALGAILNLAYEEGELHVPPRIRKLPSSSREVVAPSVSDVTALLAAAEDLRPKAPFLPEIILLVMDTGLRRNELFNLTWSDVDLGGGALTVRTPGRERLGQGKPYQEWLEKERIVPLTTRARGILESLHGQVPNAPTDLVIPNEDGCPYIPLDPRVHRGYRGFDEAVRKSGLKGQITFLSLRHLFAYRLISRGVPLVLVGDLMGYESPRKARETYGHWEQEGAVAAFSRQWFDMGDQGRIFAYNASC